MLCPSEVVPFICPAAPVNNPLRALPGRSKFAKLRYCRSQHSVERQASLEVCRTRQAPDRMPLAKTGRPAPEVLAALCGATPLNFCSWHKSAMHFRCCRQRNQTFMVRRVLRNFRRHDQPRFFFHRDLSVVALLKTILCLHDPALRIGEVLLLLLWNFSELSMMSRTPALRPHSRSPSAVVLVAARRAIFFLLPLFQSLLCFFNFFQPVLAPLQFFRKLIATPLCSILLILGFVNRLRAPPTTPRFPPLVSLPPASSAHNSWLYVCSRSLAPSSHRWPASLWKAGPSPAPVSPPAERSPRTPPDAPAETGSPCDDRESSPRPERETPHPLPASWQSSVN